MWGAYLSIYVKYIISRLYNSTLSTDHTVQNELIQKRNMFSYAFKNVRFSRLRNCVSCLCTLTNVLERFIKIWWIVVKIYRPLNVTIFMGNIFLRFVLYLNEISCSNLFFVLATCRIVLIKDNLCGHCVLYPLFLDYTYVLFLGNCRNSFFFLHTWKSCMPTKLCSGILHFYLPVNLYIPIRKHKIS